MSAIRENNLPPLPVHPPPRHPISRFHWGILGSGHYLRGGLYTACHERRCTELPHPVINDQTLILSNFEGPFLLSPSELRQEVCILLTTISQGIDWYKVLVVGKNGKLNDMIEVSALWSRRRCGSYKVGGWDVFIAKILSYHKRDLI